MRILFMGTPQFGARILQGLIDSPHSVVAVVTQPDRPVGRKQQLTPSPVKALAEAAGIPVWQPEKISQGESLGALMALDCDIIVTAAYGQFVPTRLLKQPRYGAINVHASLLPKYRGGAPIHYALWQGEEATGISIIEMVKAMDAGDILLQRSLPILSTDDTGTLFEKLADLGADTLLAALTLIQAGQVDRQPQDPARVTFAPTITRAQEQIDWTQRADQIDRHVRAFRPFPSTYTYYHDQRVKIWVGHELTSDEAARAGLGTEEGPMTAKPGRVVAVANDALVVAAGSRTFYAITQWQPSGKKRMTVKDYLNGVDRDQLIGTGFTFKE